MDGSTVLKQIQDENTKNIVLLHKLPQHGKFPCMLMPKIFKSYISKYTCILSTQH